MRKHSILILIALALLLLAACDKNGATDSDISKMKVYQGTKGLELEIIDKSIPDMIFENEEINLVVKFTNRGAASINDARIKIYTEREYLEFIDTPRADLPNMVTDDLELDGKEKFRIMDDFDIREYTLRARELESQSQIQKVGIMATACYEYSTQAFIDVCIDTDPYDTKPREKVCSPNPVTVSGGQGAPVAVVKVEPRMLADGDYVRPQFKIHLKNTDSGSVIRAGQSGLICSSENPERGDYNYVTLTDIRFSNYGLSDFDCAPTLGSNYAAKLENGNDYIICTIKEGRGISKSETSYMTPLYVKFDYGYIISKGTDIEIRDIGV